jgi:hypothetical protein
MEDQEMAQPGMTTEHAPWWNRVEMLQGSMQLGVAGGYYYYGYFPHGNHIRSHRTKVGDDM